jgi:cyclic beta-1,2-glucan glucanotransferase
MYFIESKSRRCQSTWRVTVAAILLATWALYPASIAFAASPDSYGLLDSGEQGALNIGQSQAEMSKVPDTDAIGEVVKLDYTIPMGSAAGIWTKGYPAELTRDAVDTVTIRAQTASEEQASQILVKAEIKGTTGIQVISLELTPGWSSTRQPVEWGRIGELAEVVFVIDPADVDDAAVGTIHLDCQFDRLPMLEKVGASIYGRWGAVVTLSIAVALLTSIANLLLGSLRSADSPATSDPNGQASVFSGFPKDVAFGTAVVLLVIMAFAIQWLGTKSALEAGYVYLGIALLGGLVGELWKLGQTGKHLTGLEAFRNVLVTGLLAASSSSLPIWQAPAVWADLLTLSATGATVFCLIYHIANAYLLATSKKHVRGVGAAITFAIPYAFGLLLALQSESLATALADVVTRSSLPDTSAIVATVGYVLFVFGFNEFLVNALCLMTRRRPLLNPLAHFYLLLFAAAAIAAPRIADLGSGAVALPSAVQPLAALAATMVSQGALWGLVFMLTGVILDGMRGGPPSPKSILDHGIGGAKKGMVFSGILLGILLCVNAIVHWSVAQTAYGAAPWLVLAVCGALAYPLAKTIVESFDGSQSFFGRAMKAYSMPVLYARGIVIGLGASYALGNDFFALTTAQRIWFGFGVGVTAYAGVSFLRDCILTSQGRGSIKPWRTYFVEGLLGGFVGAGLGFYLDTSQVPVVLEKFKLYNSFGLAPVADEFYPLISKWGHIQLEPYTGGAKLLFNEALKGVIGWGTAAWMFAINRSFLTAIFQRETAPIRRIFSREGMAELTDGTIHVLRWGLWMAPIIFTFLRQMADPTWYNQDGAVRTVFCIFNDVTMPSGEFHEWSLKVFMWVLAYDFFRILIWLDHMGLRVATLVNLSFLGMDRLDERAARFIGPSATARFIPEGVKRFTTWAPLLIPFYIPARTNWDWAWSQSEAIQNASSGILPRLLALPGVQLAGLAIAAVAGTSLISFTLRTWRQRSANRRQKEYRLANRRYAVTATAGGELNSQLVREGYDVTRRAYEGIDPAGRALFLAEECGPTPCTSWPVAGNYPEELFAKSEIECDGSTLRLTNVANGIQATVTISLPSTTSAAELWEIELQNLTDSARNVKVVPYLEWVLNAPGADRGHTQYNRLFPEMSYESELNAVLALHRYTKKLGVLAADSPAQGFLTSRLDFIGRAGSVWSPRVLETFDFLKPHDTDACPTFDPIGCLLLELPLNARGSNSVRLLIGCADDRDEVAGWIKRHLDPPASPTSEAASPSERKPLIGHGEILPGTPQPYYEFTDNGQSLRVLTPFTPRPYDHSMSNSLGHVLCVTNRGLHSSASVNAQQNRITTDWADTATAELPPEVFYLYDPDKQQWFSPTYLPLKDQEASYDVRFGVDGTATFHMERGEIATELTTYVPPDDPTGVYLLTVTNKGQTDRRLRFAPYFQIALADNPENAGSLKIIHDRSSDTLFFENPRNTFRSGPAFAAMSHPVEHVETRRGRFFGKGRSVAHPMFVEKGEPLSQETDDLQSVAGLLTTLDIPAGESCTVAVVLGQADDRRRAEEVVHKFCNRETAEAHLVETRSWWNGLMQTLRVETTDSEFDGYLNWLKYQALAERIWARKGFYQASGAFGFRDQLQDTVNMIWVDPALARRQILLHAAQQFLEGDVVHWFFRLQDGRTGFACRSHASDNPLWLGWGVVEYLRMTGDESILDEKVSYLTAETPLEPLPKGKHGMGFFPHRSPVEESVYQHCLRAFDLVLEKRLGVNGLPLIGAGDWNDGLDEIGSEGRGESVWLGFFFYYILKQFVDVVQQKEGSARYDYYVSHLEQLKEALERTWREDRYLRAFHDDGTEIGVKDSGIWEIDALTAAWAVMSGINPDRGLTVFDTAIRTLERDNVVLLGWPALREDSKPYLGRSSRYPEGVRENGMYCHGVQWLIKASRLLAERFAQDGDEKEAARYRETAYRLWRKISPLAHMAPGEIEVYGGQPNKQSADMLTTFDTGRMIWNGYTGAAGWMLRQACEGVIGATLVDNQVVPPADLQQLRGDLQVRSLQRGLDGSPLT